MTVKKIGIAIALALGFIVTGVATYLYLTRIPQIEQDPTTFWKQKGFEQVSVEPDLSWIIRRARVDSMLFPTEVGPRELVVQSAHQSADYLYIVFRPVGTSHTAIVYAYRVSNRTPLWKAQIAMD